MHQGIQVADRCAALNPSDLGLPQPYPLAEQGLGDAAGAVDRVVVGVHAVDTSDPADVLGGEGIPELLGLPECGRHLGWSDELIPRDALAAGALAPGVVRS
jgi:hypothetical protein